MVVRGVVVDRVRVPQLRGWCSGRVSVTVVGWFLGHQVGLQLQQGPFVRGPVLWDGGECAGALH